VIVVGVQKMRIRIEMQIVKTAYNVLGGNEESSGNWTRGHSCYILAKNLSSFSLCPETLAEKISRKHSM
jgi:hypothetical protein